MTFTFFLFVFWIAKDYFPLLDHGRHELLKIYDVLLKRFGYACD